ncbi:hypothetical protein AAG747_00480 [Rapidithrix thailandica]|uniref:Uncharacterized protein n=1 Tax=Rapidithrix thailandica TaxID=413964 RepID=A0AAW9S1T0_9BACT
MKGKFLFPLLLLPYAFLANAQTTDILMQSYDEAIHQQVGTYRLPKHKGWVQFPIGSSDIAKRYLVDPAHLHQVSTIELVYTDYPKGMDMRELNLSRFRALRTVLPGIFQQPGIRWRVTRQTDPNDAKEATAMFHGFVITLKNNLQSFQEQVLDSIPQNIQKEMVEAPDSTTYAVFERKAPGWNEVVIISDWTLSMYSYTWQLLQWHLENYIHSPIIHFVFFNDGDRKSTHQKQIGKTGGIYKTSSQSVATVARLMYHIRKRGNGGDRPENDLEAVLYAQRSYPSADEFVLIADDWSKVRDMELLTYIKRPVRIVLPEAQPIVKEGAVYPWLIQEYIKLALHTGGSIHTKSQDYESKEELLALKKWVDERYAKAKTYWKKRDPWVDINTLLIER